MNTIEVNNLTKIFGTFTSVDSISFQVKEGEIFGFLGANGAGKSTTIKMLCAILEPTSGDATVGGFSISLQPDEVKKNIGYMSQRFSLYQDLTVEENINFFGGIYGMSNSLLRERKNWVLNISGLEKEKSTLTGDLPGGIKQRLALGTAVMHKPKIVFLDEPTSGVDPLARRNFWELIHTLSEEGTTVFVTTHYLEEAEYCRNIILIDAGKIIAEGNPKKLKTDYLKYEIVEIECDAPLLCLKLLTDFNGVIDVSLFGNKIHAVISPENTTLEMLKIFLSEKEISVKEIVKINPTLEDVFIHLLERKK